jgi:putative membrane protein insertion efficiency factor
MQPSHDATGRISSLLLRRIERYRSTSPLANRGACRFTPTCSHYAEEALRTRALPLALLMVAWRLLRCNPLTNATADPVRREGRRPRPNAVPTIFAILGLSGLIVVVTAATAQAVGVSNGCTANINGRAAETLTKDNALVVHEGEKVAVTGTAPAGTPKSDTNNTHVEVAVIDGLFSVNSSDHPGHGAEWSGAANVDDYLKYGVGLYHVTGVANGSSGWHCEGDGYVELKDGSPLSKPIGAGALALAVIGSGGALLSARAKADEADISQPPVNADPESDEAVRAFNRDIDNAATLNMGMSFGCLVLMAVAALTGLFTHGTFAAAAPAAEGGSPRKRRFWAHGHPIAGFISGLLAGIGIAIVLQQFALWPLDVVTAIVFPLVVAVLCGVRAYLGTPYDVTTTD